MKICIITVYDSLNSGSFWQAYALKFFLEKKGNDVFFLKRNKKDKMNLIISHATKTIGFFLFKGFKKAVNKVKINNSFWKLQKKFNTITYKKAQKMDLIIIGSDTLWNIDDVYFKKNYKLFFGGQFVNNKQITYAISSANVQIEELCKLRSLNHYINNFEAISVRDDKTKNLIKEIYNKRIFNVCDPTFLLEKSDYEKMIVTNNSNDKYIFLYLFEKLTKEQENEINIFAQNNNLKIVDGIGGKCKSDFIATNTPDNFLSNIYFAKYVITDTFHGTMFSVNLEKNFVVINRNKNKVNEFLDKVDLKDRLIDGKICDVLKKEVHFNQKSMQELKNNSIEFLETILENKNKEC